MEELSKLEDESLFKWVLSGVVTVVGTAYTAVVYLWKRDESRNAREITNLQQQLGDCEKKHEEANGKILALSIEVASLKARFEMLDGSDK